MSTSLEIDIGTEAVSMIQNWQPQDDIDGLAARLSISGFGIDASGEVYYDPSGTTVEGEGVGYPEGAVLGITNTGDLVVYRSDAPPEYPYTSPDSYFV